MIALDASALVAIAEREPGYQPYRQRLGQSQAIIGPATLLELHLVLQRRAGSRASRFVDALLETPTIAVVPLTLAHFHAARDAIDTHGKGRGNPAQLNFGDCLSYAVAKVAGVPLLFKGDDFSRTDITSALPT